MQLPSSERREQGHTQTAMHQKVQTGPDKSVKNILSNVRIGYVLL